MFDCPVFIAPDTILPPTVPGRTGCTGANVTGLGADIGAAWITLPKVAPPMTSLPPCVAMFCQAAALTPATSGGDGCCTDTALVTFPVVRVFEGTDGPAVETITTCGNPAILIGVGPLTFSSPDDGGTKIQGPPPVGTRSPPPCKLFGGFASTDLVTFCMVLVFNPLLVFIPETNGTELPDANTGVGKDVGFATV